MTVAELIKELEKLPGEERLLGYPTHGGTGLGEIKVVFQKLQTATLLQIRSNKVGKIKRPGKGL